MCGESHPIHKLVAIAVAVFVDGGHVQKFVDTLIFYVLLLVYGSSSTFHFGITISQKRPVQTQAAHTWRCIHVEGMNCGRTYCRRTLRANLLISSAA